MADVLAGLTPQQRAVLGQATYRDFHAQLVQDTSAGLWTLLDFWDSLPWLQGDPASWTPWRACAAAVFGLPMTPAELAIYRKCTKRQNPPTQQADEAWLPVGRRGKKSAWSAVIASFVAAYWDHSTYTAPGEYARIPILAKDKDEAKAIKGYIDAIFETPALAWMVEDSSIETTTLSTRCEIQVKAATITAGRSRAVPLWILDEVAFFRTGDAAHPDTEILRGLRPAQATVPHPLGIAASSPYARKGELYNTYKEHFGKDSRILVWQADTLTMHPGNPQVTAHVAKEYDKDPVSAAAEYGAKFRLDVETFITDEIVDAVTEKGVPERSPVPGVQYVAFVDPSGGTSDSFTLGIAHWEHESMVHLDLLREVRPTEEGPFRPAHETEGLCRILAQYGIKDVEGDRYAGEWPREAFNKGFCDHPEDEHELDGYGLCKLRYSVAYNVSEHPKREIYRDVLPILTNGHALLIEHKRLKAQLVDLERRPSASGEIIDHPPGGKDDVANAAAGALCRAERLKLRRKAYVPPPKTLVEARGRKLHDRLKARIREQQKGNRGSGNGGWV